MDKERIRQITEELREEFDRVGDEIWRNPETNFQEFVSSGIQMDVMRKAGFRITNPYAGMKTAFTAEYGYGKPVIAILGYVDGLPNLSQVPDIFEEKPLEPGANGHGCGHHLVGAGSMQAACAIKKYMEETGTVGTLRYYCTPAEEGGGGKVIMAKRGAFDDIDAALCWHPDESTVIGLTGLAVANVTFRFTGQGAHAGAIPWEGRSALDAAELMTTGIPSLLEHVLPTPRLHSAYTDVGGEAPNVVQAHAAVLVAVRAEESDYMLEVYDRVHDIAKGAALMTGTRLEEPEIGSVYSSAFLNRTIDSVVLENMRELLPLKYTDEEYAYAKGYQPFGRNKNAASPLNTKVMEDYLAVGGSSDYGDVTWFAPASMFSMLCFATGTRLHTWFSTAQGTSSIAHKGRNAAAKIIACTAMRLFEDSELLEAAKEEWRKNLNGRTYNTLMDVENCKDAQNF